MELEDILFYLGEGSFIYMYMCKAFLFLSASRRESSNMPSPRGRCYGHQRFFWPSIMVDLEMASLDMGLNIPLFTMKETGAPEIQIKNLLTLASKLA